MVRDGVVSRKAFNREEHDGVHAGDHAGVHDGIQAGVHVGIHSGADTLVFRLKGVEFAYNSIPALNGLTLDVARGDFLAIIGPNGSGKTTLLKCMARLLAPTGGSVLLHGRPLQAHRPAEVARKLGVVFQENRLDFDFTVEELVLMGRLPHLSRFQQESSRDREIAARALGQTNLADYARRLVSELSGGERQRAVIARALAQEPEILMLDEPTSHLDISHQVEIMDLLTNLRRERRLTIIAVLHDLNLASLYADRLVLLHAGRIFAAGHPREVLTEANISEAYGSRVQIGTHPSTGRPQVFLVPVSGGGV